MRFISSFLAASVCIFAPALIDCAALPVGRDAFNAKKVLERQAGNAYRITVYQNAQCTGEAIMYSADATECAGGLGSGGAGFQLLALDPDGQVNFWSDAGCQGNIVDNFNPDADQTGTDCKPLMGNPLSVQFEDV